LGTGSHEKAQKGQKKWPEKCFFWASFFILKSEALNPKSETNPNYTNLNVQNLSGLTDNGFLRVSADTKTCGSPLNICHLYGGRYYTNFQTKVKKKVLYKHINSGALGT
jgi:hypothetical protein